MFSAIKVKKKGVIILFALMSLIMCLSTTVSVKTAQAAELMADQRNVSDPAPTRWSNLVSILVVLGFDNGKGSLSATVIAQPETSRITGSALLERLNSDNTYTKIESWDGLSSSGDTMRFSANYYVARGYTYRFTFTATAYINGVGETASISKSTYAS